MHKNLATETQHGLIYALGAFLLWGLAPIYFKAVDHVTPLEVLAHRIVWSVVFLGLVILAAKSQRQALFRINKTQLAFLFFTSFMVSFNWFTFIWAVGENRILETSLGYFINPLVSVMLGMIFLHERLRPMQTVAIGLAGLGVLNQIVFVGSLPWVALVLAFSFGLYGLIRKKIQVDPIAGLAVETVLLLPFALFYLGWLSYKDSIFFGQVSLSLDLLLVCAGLMTSLPLLLFAAGNKRLSLTVIGLVQYITPTMTFFIAILMYDEPFEWQQLATFGFIWAGLVIFTAEGIKQQRNKQTASENAAS